MQIRGHECGDERTKIWYVIVLADVLIVNLPCVLEHDQFQFMCDAKRIETDLLVNLDGNSLKET
jgi:hypothetical protein